VVILIIIIIIIMIMMIIIIIFIIMKLINFRPRSRQSAEPVDDVEGVSWEYCDVGRFLSSKLYNT
jgi:flagellar biogenesis protein FliO